MSRKDDLEMQELLYSATDYTPELKQRVWEQIEKELFEDQDEEMLELIKKKKRRKLKLTIALSAATLIGGSLMAEPIIDYVQKYFGESKAQDYYDDDKAVMIRKQATLYKSDLGYMTFYNKDYFEIKKEENKESFVAKTGSDNGKVEIELVKGKTFEELKDEFKKLKSENVSNLTDENGIEQVYAKIDQKTKMTKSVCLCDAEELGVFKITITYKESSEARSNCWYISDQFNYLNESRMNNMTKQKKQLKFDFDETKLELIRNSTSPDGIYLQKKDEQHMGEIYASYCESLDSPEETLKKEKINVQKQKEEFEKMIEKASNPEDKELLKGAIPVLSMEENDLKVPAIKFRESHPNYSYLYYLIENGAGGCYRIMLHDPEGEACKEIQKTLTLVPGEQQVMNILDVQDNGVG